jgi:methyl-accepting chemotaxis protein
MLRKNYIVKPRLQIKFLLIALLVIVVTAIAVYYAFWSSLVRAPGMDQLSSGELRALEHAYQVSFVWVIAILGLAVGLESIFFFHKLVGPIYVFGESLKKLADGELTFTVHSRKRDELKDVAAGFNAMIENMGGAVKADRAAIDEIKQKIDQGKLAEAKEQLGTLTRWFKVD